MYAVGFLKDGGIGCRVPGRRRAVWIIGLRLGRHSARRIRGSLRGLLRVRHFWRRACGIGLAGRRALPVCGRGPGRGLCGKDRLWDAVSLVRGLRGLRNWWNLRRIRFGLCVCVEVAVRLLPRLLFPRSRFKIVHVNTPFPFLLSMHFYPS